MILILWFLKNFRQSLEALNTAKLKSSDLITKSSIMLGLGETDKEVEDTLKGKIT